MQKLITKIYQFLQLLQRGCGVIVVYAMTTMTAVAFDGTTRFGCYVYVHDGCVTSSLPCTEEEYNFLLDNCDEYPSDNTSIRPSYSVKPPSEKVQKSYAYKKKIKKLKADIRRK